MDALKDVDLGHPALVLTAAVGLWVLSVVAAWWRRTALLDRIPSPPRLHLILGHAKEVASSKHHRTMLRWTEDLGPMYTLKVLWWRVVIVSDPVLVHQLLRRNPDVDKCQKSYGMLNQFISEKGYAAIFTASTHSPHWRAVRKGASPAFSPKALRNGFPQIQRTIRELVALLSTAASEGRSLDIDRLLMRDTLDVLGRVGFGVDFKAVAGFEAAAAMGKAAVPEQETDVFNIIEACLSDVNKLLGNPLRNYMFWDESVRLNRRYWKMFLKRMTGVALAVKEAGVQPENEWSLAAHLLKVTDPLTGKPLENDRLVPEISAAFVAGMHTTAHSMSWTIYLISTHPEVEAKVCAELASLGLLATPKKPKPRQVEYEDLPKLTYLTAANKEAMRLKPVGADGTAIDFKHDIQLGGHTVPAGTVLWVPFHSTFNSKHYWEHPDQYLPERWLVPGTEYALPPGTIPNSKAVGNAAAKAGGKSVHISASSGTAAAAAAAGAGTEEDESRQGGGNRPLRFFPFSQGNRDCIGLSLAKLNYTATLATLLGTFHFKLTKEMEGPGGVEDSEIVEMALHPTCGLHVHITPRATMSSATESSS